MAQLPDLVINEPTATGWLRAELYGDQEKAKGYLHVARNVLGAMRSMYGVNERIAQGQGGGFYHQWATLPDGTTIHAITNDGHDTVRIDARSSSRTGSSLKELRKVELTDVAICGTCITPDFDNRAVLWTSPDTVIDLGLLPGAFESTATDISDDGTTVVGYCNMGGGEAAFRWTEATGMENLGNLGNNFYCEATGVSRDGSIVVGVAYFDEFGGCGAWRWSRDTGMVRLPDVGLGVPFGTWLHISPSGQYIVGTISTEVLHKGLNTMGALWEETLTLRLIPLPGTISPESHRYGTSTSSGGFSYIPAENIHDDNEIVDASFPDGVSDDGVVIGHTNHTELRPERYWRVERWSNGQMIEAGDKYNYDRDQNHPTNSIFAWNIKTGEYYLLGDGTSAFQANSDAQIAGNEMIDTITSYSNYWGSGTPYQGYYYIHMINTSTMIPHGYLLTPGSAPQPLGDWSRVADVADDGSVIVGVARDDLDGTPVIWDKDGNQTELALLPGTIGGKASAVAILTSLEVTLD